MLGRSQYIVKAPSFSRTALTSLVAALSCEYTIFEVSRPRASWVASALLIKSACAGGHRMLRITKQTTREGSTLMVEGKIQGPAVQVLRNECQPYRDRAQPLTVDLAGVSFVDREGIRLLRQLTGDRVCIIHGSALLAELSKN